MTPTAILLIALSTFAHAGWNLMGKRRSPSAAFFWTASLSAGLCLSPVLLRYPQVLGRLGLPLWGLLLATGVCQAVYFVGLAGAYRNGDLSVAYPLARALPVLLVMGVTSALGLGRPLSLLGVAGIFLVAAGCLLVPMPRFGTLSARNYINRCCAFALLAACGTTGYTIIDSEALARLRLLPGLGMSNFEIAVWFMVMETLMTSLALAGYHLFAPAERRALRGVLRSNWRYAALTGLIITATYGLVLFAMGFVSNVSSLAAFRQLSIPLGAVFGIAVQKEPAAAPKLLGIAMVLAGLVLVGVA